MNRSIFCHAAAVNNCIISSASVCQNAFFDNIQPASVHDVVSVVTADLENVLEFNIALEWRSSTQRTMAFDTAWSEEWVGVPEVAVFAVFTGYDVC